MAGGPRTLRDKLRSKSDVQLALAKYELALEIFEKQRDDRNRAELPLRDLGSAYLQQGDLPNAEQYYLKALAIGEKIQDRYTEAHSLLGLGEISRHRGQYPDAAQRYRKALGDRSGPARRHP